MVTEATKEDLHEFQRLCDQGRVYEIVDWTKAGRPIRFVHGRYKKPISGLVIAVEAEGHTLLEELLKRSDWTQSELDGAAACATSRELPYLVDLLFDYGAQAGECNVFDFFKMMDVELAERALRLGLDPTKCDEFAQVLSYTGAARPLLRFYKQNAGKVKGLEEQIGIALLECIDKKQFHACIMLLWAGADAHAEYPWEPRGHFPGHSCPEVAEYDFDEDTRITAFKELAWRGDFEFYKKLKLKPNDKDKLCMIEWIGGDDSGELTEHIIEQCSAELLNFGKDGNCEALENFLCYGYSRNKKASTAKAFLERGAILKPHKDKIRRMRKSILEGGGFFACEIIELLIEYKQDPELIWELGRTPKMQDSLRYTQAWKQFERAYKAT